MASISSEMYTRLRQVLLNCGPFESNEQLRAVFAHPKLRPWRNSVPEASSRSGRVDRTLAEMSERWNTDDENALVLFLQVSRDRLDAETKCHHRLKDMADELDRSSGDRPRKSTENPSRASLDEALVAEIEGLIREDKLLEAIQKLIDLEFNRRTAMLLANRLRRTQNRERQGALTRAEADTEYNKITQAILDLLSG